MLFLYNSIVPLIHSCYIFIRYCFLQAIKIYSRKYLNFLQDKGETYHEKKKSSYFDYGEVVSIGPAQYEGVIKLTLADDSFLEITLDDDGFLTSIYGPYAPGTIH